MPSEVICLYELSGYAAAPWAEAGYKVFCYDKETSAERVEGNIIYLPWDATDPAQNLALVQRHRGKAVIVLAFPPCTDLAVSGARHFRDKRRKNPSFQIEAMQLVYIARDIAKELGAPYAIENPVSMISSFWRKPDFIFDPYEFGGYLPEDDQHPKWPSYIRARDAYPKKTCYWTGGGFVLPEKKRVPVRPGYSLQTKKLGGKSKKTKEIRSMSPRGIARAIYLANRK